MRFSNGFVPLNSRRSLDNMWQETLLVKSQFAETTATYVKAMLEQNQNATQTSVAWRLGVTVLYSASPQWDAFSWIQLEFKRRCLVDIRNVHSEQSAPEQLSQSRLRSLQCRSAWHRSGKVHNDQQCNFHVCFRVQHRWRVLLRWDHPANAVICRLYRENCTMAYLFLSLS